jgi:glycerol-3-phosphate dehydrogenase
VALLACGCASASVRLIEMEGGKVSTCRKMQYNVVDAVIWLDGKLPGARQ